VEIRLGDEFSRNAFAFNGYASAMKAGLSVADMLSTVSPRYSQEIQMPQEGTDLTGFCASGANRFVGITNGVGLRSLES
jgi:starch synthase